MTIEFPTHHRQTALPDIVQVTSSTLRKAKPVGKSRGLLSKLRRSTSVLANPKQRHIEAELSELESFQLRAAANEAVTSMTAVVANDQLARLEYARKFAREVLRKVAPTMGHVLTLARDGAIDSFLIEHQHLDEPETVFMAEVKAVFIGEPFNYKTQNGGAIVMTIQPMDGSLENTQTTRGEFRWHSDDALVARDSRVEWITLSGFFNPTNTRTWYSPAAGLEWLLSTTSLMALSEARFSFRAPISFNLASEVWSGARPVLSRDAAGNLEIAYPSYATRVADPDDEAAKQALVELDRAIQALAFGVAVGPGVTFGFSNIRGTHMRDPIGAGDRKLFRTYSRSDLEDLRRRTGERGPVFDATQTFDLGS